MRTLMLSLTLSLAACSPAGAALPADATVLPGSMARSLLGQCSRATPSLGESTWQPGEADILALEAALPAALRAQPPRSDAAELARAPNGWRRQYVGIVRGGRRFVYGSFFPADASRHGDPDQWRRETLIVCDGGPSFFGVEYDVQGRRVTHVAYNGMA
jgi:hypothetical protein